MEKYNLHVSRDTLEKIKKCATACIDHQLWLPVEELGYLIGADLSDLFGSGDLGWSPFTLQYGFKILDNPHNTYVSVPKPEEITVCHDVRTVREQMEDLASRERPALKDWLNKSGIHNGTDPFDKVCMRDALAILRRLVENAQHGGYVPYLYPELINQLAEMRTLIHTLIGTGENCCDETDNEYPKTVRKALGPDAMDVFRYAIQALLNHKDEPSVKRALNSIYGSAMCERDGLAGALKRSTVESMARLNNVVNGCSEDADTPPLAQCECENVRADEPNALFVTIETGMFDATLENVAAVNLFISTASEGRDIHLRII